MTRRAPLRLLLTASLLLPLGCVGAPPLGPVQAPEPYPDRTSAEAVWRSYLWAWRQGDLPVLEQVLGWRMHARFHEELEARGEDATAEWYRRDAADLRVVDAEWTTLGEAVAYLRVTLASSQVPRVELDFALVRRPDGWVLTERRLLR